MAVTETANKALTALASKGAITAPAAVGECAISVERPEPPPHSFTAKPNETLSSPMLHKEGR